MFDSSRTLDILKYKYKININISLFVKEEEVKDFLTTENSLSTKRVEGPEMRVVIDRLLDFWYLEFIKENFKSRKW